ncbi:MAG: peptide ABC transporter substrate-binding protein [Bdellovibrionota bacterium]
MKNALLILAIGFFSTVTFAAPKDTLTIGVAAEFESLNPLIANQAAARYLMYTAYRPMVILSPDLKWEPKLIKTIPTLKNKLAKRNGQGLDLTLEFTDDVWGDGTPITCADLEFSWQVGKSKNTSVPAREPYENITSVKWDKANPKKCSLTYAKATYDYFTTFPDLVPAHIERAVFDKFKDQPEGYDKNSNYTKNPTMPGLWHGPYMVSEVKLGSHVILVPNPKFAGKKPFFKQVIFKLVPSNATLEANLRSGSIDMITPAAGLGVDQADDFDKKVKAEKLPYEVRFEDGLVYAHIDLNLENPILADVRVRKALSLAANKKEIVTSLMGGRGKEALHFVTDKDPWYTDKITTYKFNRREANKLLDEAGWKMGANGFREKDGKPLSLTLIAAAGAKINETIEVFLQSQFKTIGVELLVKNEPARVFFGETTNHRKFQMALFSWVSTPESNPRPILHSTSIPTEKNSWAGQNYTGYKNAEVDKLIESLEQELDAPKRAALAKKIIEFYTSEVPVIPIYFRQMNSVVPKGIKGYRLSGNTNGETLFIENWSM